MSDARRIIIHELANKVSALKSVAEADPKRFDRDTLLTIDSIDLLLRYLLDTELFNRLKREEKRNVPLKRVLEDVVSELGLLSSLREVSVKLEGCDLEASTNEFALRRIVYNLLHNAVKFSPKGGLVRIRCSEEGGKLNIHITNEVAEGEEKLKGTGFGINLTKELASWLGAELEIRDRGKTFESVLSLPRN